MQRSSALLALWILGAYHAGKGKREPIVLLAAGAVLTLSLLFRTIDEVGCSSISLGTHFPWHVLNGVVLYLAFRGLVTNWRAVSPRPSAGKSLHVLLSVSKDEQEAPPQILLFAQNDTGQCAHSSTGSP